MKLQIYLDYAAATPVSKSVLMAMMPYFSEQFYNPSSIYKSAELVKKALTQARADIAQIIGAKPGEIIFTSGATEANNLAIAGIMKQYPNQRLLISAIEHDSVWAPASAFESKKLDILPVNNRGRIETESLEAKIKDDTVLISIGYANHELGVIQPMREIANLIKKIRGERLVNNNRVPLFFHTDVSQASAYLDINTSRLGVDLMTLSSNKIYGPKQTGCLFSGSNIKLLPLIYGGGQERNLRSGTENTANIVGFATALVENNNLREAEVSRVKDLRDLMQTKLLQALPKISLNGDPDHRLPNFINFSLPGIDGERTVMELDDDGILIATGAACSALSSDKPSRVQKAIGLSPDLIRGSLRITLGRMTNLNQVNIAVSKIINNLQS